MVGAPNDMWVIFRNRRLGEHVTTIKSSSSHGIYLWVSISMEIIGITSIH
jgi:hypothetical protein